MDVQICDSEGGSTAAVAAFLRRVEVDVLGGKLADRMDLFVGTSTGAFVAGLMGALRFDAADIEQLYEKQFEVCALHIVVQ